MAQIQQLLPSRIERPSMPAPDGTAVVSRWSWLFPPLECPPERAVERESIVIVGCYDGVPVKGDTPVILHALLCQVVGDHRVEVVVVGHLLKVKLTTVGQHLCQRVGTAFAQFPDGNGLLEMAYPVVHLLLSAELATVDLVALLQ